MNAKIFIIFCTEALFIQIAFGKVGRLVVPSYGVNGNSVMDNAVIIGSSTFSGLGVGAPLGVANNGLGMPTSGLSIIQNGFGAPKSIGGIVSSGSVSGLNTANSGVNLGPGLSVVSPSLNIVGSNLANGLGLGNVGVAINGANLGKDTVSNSILPSSSYIDLSSLSGGGVLPISSYSSLTPNGLSVLSDNAIDGALLVNGQLPFLSAVAFEGVLPSNGIGGVTCGCGSSGNVGVVSENYGIGLGGLGSGLNGLGIANRFNLGTGGLGLVY